MLNIEDIITEYCQITQRPVQTITVQEYLQFLAYNGSSTFTPVQQTHSKVIEDAVSPSFIEHKEDQAKKSIQSPTPAKVNKTPSKEDMLSVLRSIAG